jgi:hypothetical protein
MRRATRSNPAQTEWRLPPTMRYAPQRRARTQTGVLRWSRGGYSQQSMHVFQTAPAAASRADVASCPGGSLIIRVVPRGFIYHLRAARTLPAGHFRAARGSFPRCPRVISALSRRAIGALCPHAPVQGTAERPSRCPQGRASPRPAPVSRGALTSSRPAPQPSPL